MTGAVNAAGSAASLRSTLQTLGTPGVARTTPTTASIIYRGLAPGKVLSGVASLYAGDRQSQAGVAPVRERSAGRTG